MLKPLSISTSAVVALVLLPNLAAAAPDNTLGMAIMAAEVGSDGTLLRSSGATSASNPTGGIYIVQFDRNVTNCYPSATLGTGSGVTTGQIGAFQGGGTSITVATANSAGNSTNLGFRLTVFCSN